jgi:hypothetical protein
MFRFAAAVLALLPLAVQAAPLIGPQLDPTPPTEVYPALAPADLGGAPPGGWGWRASVEGRWLDLRDHNLDWADDPATPAREIEAGLEWRRGPASAVVGYGQYDGGADRDPALWDRLIPGQNSTPSDPGVLGLSLVLHSR